MAKNYGKLCFEGNTNSSVPFIVVQDQLMNDTGYDSIVVPLDLNNETKQKLEMVASIAHYFDSEVHLITPNESDEFLSNKLKANRIWAAKYLKEKCQVYHPNCR